MNKSAHFVHVNGKIVHENDAMIPPFHSGLFYGAGCFETFRTDRGAFFRFDDHINRLKRGLAYLGVPQGMMPNDSQIRTDVELLLQRNSLEKNSARVRIQFSLLEKQGYGFDGQISLIKLIQCSKLLEQGEAVRLKTSAVRVVPHDCKPSDLKLSNMLHYRDAFREAQKSGFDDALMLNCKDFIAETSIANIFWKTGNTVFMPSIKTDILPGITRSVLADIIKTLDGYSLVEGEYQIEQIKEADCVWITNSVQGIRTVSSIDEKEIRTDQEFIERLNRKFEQLRSDQSS